MFKAFVGVFPWEKVLDCQLHWHPHQGRLDLDPFPCELLGLDGQVVRTVVLTPALAIMLSSSDTCPKSLAYMIQVQTWHQYFSKLTRDPDMQQILVLIQILVFQSVKNGPEALVLPESHPRHTTREKASARILRCYESSLTSAKYYLIPLFLFAC